MNLKFWRQWVFVFGEGFSCGVNMSDYLLIWNVEWCQNMTNTHWELSVKTSNCLLMDQTTNPCICPPPIIQIMLTIIRKLILWSISRVGKQGILAKAPQKAALPRGWNYEERKVKSNWKSSVWAESLSHFVAQVHPGSSSTSYLFFKLRSDTVVGHVSFLNQNEFCVMPRWKQISSYKCMSGGKGLFDRVTSE